MLSNNYFRSGTSGSSLEDFEMVRETVLRFLDREVEPYYEDWERSHLLPRDFWTKMGEAGLLCVDVPEVYGGSDGGVELCQLILWEMARAGYGGLATAYNIHANTVAPYLLNLGTEEQKSRWLPSMVDGSTIGALAMTEPGAGSDVAAMQTSAVRDGDSYLINGSKVFITNGIQADLVIVCAKTDRDAGSRGISLFLVDASLPGFSRGKSIEKIGQKCSDTAELFFNDLRVPVTALLGQENLGFKQLMRELPRERIGGATQAVGQAQGALEITAEYVKERVVFDTQLSAMQNTRFKLAEVRSEVAASRAYLEHCINEFSSGVLSPAEAAGLKLCATEMQLRAVDACLQLFGGYGYTAEYPVSRFYVDARVQTIYGGSSEIMKEILARDLLDR